MNSKATFLELSNPFMHLVKRTKKPQHMALFAAVFTVVRIVWLPILVWQLLQHGVPVTDPRLVCVSAFYMLNLFWYFKILNILYQGAMAGGSLTSTKKEV
jgi:TLC domain